MVILCSAIVFGRWRVDGTSSMARLCKVPHGKDARMPYSYLAGAVRALNATTQEGKQY